jgi:TRAP-type C4-dicarboxylate transport system permease small subunit
MAWKKRLVSAARAVERAIALACNVLLIASGLGMLTLLTVNVVMRYGFSAGFGSAPDLTELLFSIFVMAGIAQAARLGAHIATELFLYLLAGRARLALALVIHAVTAAAYFLLAWYAMLNAIVAHDQRSPVVGIPYSVGYGCLAVGLALVGVFSLAAIVRHTLGGEPLEVDLANTGPGAA